MSNLKNRINALILEKERLGFKNTNISKKELELLKKGLPIQKIIGFIQFDKVKIFIKEKVFIPRYETQELVEFASGYLKKGDKVLDICCGSGFIGISLKSKIPTIDLSLSDISEAAIRQTKINLKANNMEAKVIKSNLFEKITDTFDVIISNPPYIHLKDSLDKTVLDYEPATSLFAKKNGNYFYKQITKFVSKYIKKNGYLIFEISPRNKNYLWWKKFKFLKDINGKYRIAYKKIK